MQALPIEAIYPRGTRIILEAIRAVSTVNGDFAFAGDRPSALLSGQSGKPKMARDRVARLFSQPMQADREMCYPVVRGTMTR